MKWTPEKLKYFQDNYYAKTNIELSKIIGLSYIGLLHKARELGLPDKRKLGLNKGKIRGTYRKEIPDYALNNEIVREAEGRKNTRSIQNIKKTMHKGKSIKLEVRNLEKQGRIKSRHFKGRVISKTDAFIVLQGKNYRECFTYIDIYSGRIVLEG